MRNLFKLLQILSIIPMMINGCLMMLLALFLKAPVNDPFLGFVWHLSWFVLCLYLLVFFSYRVMSWKI